MIRRGWSRDDLKSGIKTADFLPYVLNEPIYLFLYDI